MSDNREYQTYTLKDYNAEGDPLIVSFDYLVEMFDLEVQNEKGKPIVITLREKDQHVAARGLE